MQANVKRTDKTNDEFAAVLADMPTIHSGQYADLKIDTGNKRVWLSRMTAADGETQPVQIERLIDGRWVDVTDEEGDA